MSEISPNLVKYGEVEDANYFAQAGQLMEEARKKQLNNDILDVPMKQLEDFYMTDSISRASPTMAKCVQAVKKQRQSKY